MLLSCPEISDLGIRIRAGRCQHQVGAVPRNHKGGGICSTALASQDCQDHSMSRVSPFISYRMVLIAQMMMRSAHFAVALAVFTK